MDKLKWICYCRDQRSKNRVLCFYQHSTSSTRNGVFLSIHMVIFLITVNTHTCLHACIYIWQHIPWGISCSDYKDLDCSEKCMVLREAIRGKPIKVVCLYDRTELQICTSIPCRWETKQFLRRRMGDDFTLIRNKSSILLRTSAHHWFCWSLLKTTGCTCMSHYRI